MVAVRLALLRKALGLAVSVTALCVLGPCPRHVVSGAEKPEAFSCPELWGPDVRAALDRREAFRASREKFGRL